ncbi:MAG: sigma-70 family RNA polymerase sigma factor [Bacteroidota bacterium]
MKELTNRDIIQMLQSRDETTNEEVFKYLYRFSFKTIKGYILKRNGSQQDADDVFQDGLISLYMMARQGKLAPDTKIEAYLFTVCRNRWHKNMGKAPAKVELDQVHQSVPEEDLQIQKILDKERQQMVSQWINRIGEDCRKVLTYYYFERLKMKEIMEKLQYSSEQVVKNKKYNCMKKLRAIILENPESKSLMTS